MGIKNEKLQEDKKRNMCDSKKKKRKYRIFEWSKQRKLF